MLSADIVVTGIQGDINRQVDAKRKGVKIVSFFSAEDVRKIAHTNVAEER